MAFEQARWLTDLRAELDWVRDLPAQCGQQELRHLDQAYKNWWNKDHPAGAPDFHKRGTRLSVSFPGQACELRKLSKKWSEVKLPKLGWVKIRTGRPIRGELRNVTVTKDALGWQCSLGLFQDVKPAEKNNKPGCGVDFGIACSAFVSDEVNPRLKPASLTPGEQRRLLASRRGRSACPPACGSAFGELVIVDGEDGIPERKARVLSIVGPKVRLEFVEPLPDRRSA